MADKGWIHKFAFENGALSNDEVGRSAMADGFLSADTSGRAKLADGLVNTAKLADGSVTLAKISSSKLLATGSYGISEYGRSVYG